MTPDEIKALREQYDVLRCDQGDPAVLALCDALEKSEATCAAMREAIRHVEFVAMASYDGDSTKSDPARWVIRDRCPNCNHTKEVGHYRHCRLSAALSSTAGQSMLDELARLRDENIRLSSNLGNAEVEVSDLRAWVGQAVAAMKTVLTVSDLTRGFSIEADTDAIAACLAAAEKLGVNE